MTAIADSDSDPGRDPKPSTSPSTSTSKSKEIPTNGKLDENGNYREEGNHGEGESGERVIKEEKKTTLYFAYGSNLSLYQMNQRCPGSRYYGFGILRGWRWFINGRGYANGIVSSSHNTKEMGKEVDTTGDDRGEDVGVGVHVGEDVGEGVGVHEDEREDVVEGMLYTLTPEDEANLDRAEGVPRVYEKQVLGIEVLRWEEGSVDGVDGVDGDEGSKEGEGQEKEEVGPQRGERRGAPSPSTRTLVEALVYVDVVRVEEGKCKFEYIARMNRGIRDARVKGMSERFIEEVLRKYVPREDDEEVEERLEDPFFRS